MKKIILLSLLCVAMLLPSITSAQSMFDKNKIIVWKVIDETRKIDESAELEYRTSIIQALQGSENYEVFECSLDDIENYIKTKRWQSTPPNRIKAVRALYPEVNFILVPSIMKKSDGQNSKTIITLLVKLYDVIEKFNQERANTVDTVADLQAMPGACAKLLSGLLEEEITAPELPSQEYTPLPGQVNEGPFDGYMEEVKGLNIRMIRVEGGIFTMGATSEQGEDAQDDERPAHDVEISEFYISECEITQAQWSAIMGKTIKQQRDQANPNEGIFGEGPQYPIYYVTYYEALEFCQKLSNMTGRTYLLPTEAQWEYAARGGKYRSKYKYSGFNQLGMVGWYRSNSNNGAHQVGQLRENALGIKDMCGNVWEWCLDYQRSYTHDFVKDPIRSDGKYPVMRGGSWGKSASECRVSYRMNADPNRRDKYIGFRIVCIPKDTQR